MVTAKDVFDGVNTVVKTAADLAGAAGQSAEGAAKTATQFHSWATNEVSRQIAASACDSLEIAVAEVQRRSLSAHPVTITTTIALGPAEVVVSVQLAPVDPAEQHAERKVEP